MADSFRPLTRPRPSLSVGVAETCRVIGLDISVSETRSNHTSLAKPDLLYKFNLKHAKVPGPSFQISDRLMVGLSNIRI